MTEDIPIIIDNGGYKIRSGFAGEEFPRASHSNVIYKAPDAVGSNPFGVRGVRKLFKPMDGGFISNWDCMEEIWHNTFFKELDIDPSKRKTDTDGF